MLSGLPRPSKTEPGGRRAGSDLFYNEEVPLSLVPNGCASSGVSPLSGKGPCRALCAARSGPRPHLLRNAGTLQITAERIVDEGLIITAMCSSNKFAEVIDDAAVEPNGDANLLRWQRSDWPALPLAKIVLALHIRVSSYCARSREVALHDAVATKRVGNCQPPPLGVHPERSSVTSDGGLLLVRELPELMGFGALIERHLADARATSKWLLRSRN
jgi:hypothetical protein